MSCKKCEAIMKFWLKNPGAMPLDVNYCELCGQSLKSDALKKCHQRILAKKETAAVTCNNDRRKKSIASVQEAD